jgi:lipid-binding SYLF domain-containing protein
MVGNIQQQGDSMRKLHLVMTSLVFLLGCSFFSGSAQAASAAEIDKAVNLALEKLYASTPAAAELAKVSKGVLVFPDVVKAELIVGGQYGEGALRVDGKTVGYYNTLRLRNS